MTGEYFHSKKKKKVTGECQRVWFALVDKLESIPEKWYTNFLISNLDQYLTSRNTASSLWDFVQNVLFLGHVAESRELH